jgi:hypothetical protein
VYQLKKITKYTLKLSPHPRNCKEIAREYHYNMPFRNIHNHLIKDSWYYNPCSTRPTYAADITCPAFEYRQISHIIPIKNCGTQWSNVLKSMLLKPDRLALISATSETL